MNSGAQRRKHKIVTAKQKGIRKIIIGKRVLATKTFRLYKDIFLSLLRYNSEIKIVHI